ncbi:hypothetical protein [Methanoregula sp.]|uniref:putative PDDEXK endonuclease n=1 Tax=Methanoregula sp. TaxID=2052170 RepID=UPI000CC51E8F|nr:hypothetical protein [Methanoregula sp.]PKG31427.1 MAG: hypothetical protein CW742_13465 [Methanoregula sp.]
MKSASCKAKGRVLQNEIVQDLRTAYPELGEPDIRPAITGQSGIDILLSSRARDLFPYAVECKNQEALNIWECLKQAEENGKKEWMVPLLIFRRHRTKTYVAIEWTEFLNLVTAVQR